MDIKLETLTWQEFKKLDLKFEDLSYEDIVRFWCLSSLADGFIAEQCGVPPDEVTKLRHSYDIKQHNTQIHICRVYGMEGLEKWQKYRLAEIEEKRAFFRESAQ